MTKLSRFRRDEDGAVTVDWVVLTAGVSILGLLVIGILTTGTTDIAGKLYNFIIAVPVAH